jgi:hypothetical protein
VSGKRTIVLQSGGRRSWCVCANVVWPTGQSIVVYPKFGTEAMMWVLAALFSRRHIAGLALALPGFALADGVAAKRKKKKGKGRKKKDACPSGDVNCDRFSTQQEAQ